MKRKAEWVAVWRIEEWERESARGGEVREARTGVKGECMVWRGMSLRLRNARRLRIATMLTALARSERGCWYPSLGCDLRPGERVSAIIVSGKTPNNRASTSSREDCAVQPRSSTGSASAGRLNLAEGGRRSRKVPTGC